MAYEAAIFEQAVALDPQFAQQWEAGEVTTPGGPRRLRMSDALGVLAKALDSMNPQESQRQIAHHKSVWDQLNLLAHARLAAHPFPKIVGQRESGEVILMPLFSIGGKIGSRLWCSLCGSWYIRIAQEATKAVSVSFQFSLREWTEWDHRSKVYMTIFQN